MHDKARKAALNSQSLNPGRGHFPSVTEVSKIACNSLRSYVLNFCIIGSLDSRCSEWMLELSETLGQPGDLFASQSSVPASNSAPSPDSLVSNSTIEALSL